MGLTRAEERGRIPPLVLLAMFFLVQSTYCQSFFCHEVALLAHNYPHLCVSRSVSCLKVEQITSKLWSILMGQICEIFCVCHIFSYISLNLNFLLRMGCPKCLCCIRHPDTYNSHSQVLPNWMNVNSWSRKNLSQFKYWFPSGQFSCPEKLISNIMES